jgi:hypothetical protein
MHEISKKTGAINQYGDGKRQIKVSNLGYLNYLQYPDRR